MPRIPQRADVAQVTSQAKEMNELTISPPRPETKQGKDDRDTDTIDLAALAGTLWRGKWLIAAFTALAILAGGIYAFVLATPIYRSTAVVMLETRQEQIVDLPSVVGSLSGDTAAVNSEVEVLKARGLMGKVVDRLNLVEDPEFNETLLPPSLKDQVKSAVKSVLGLARSEENLGPEAAAARLRDTVISSLIEHVAVRNVPQSLVFSVTVESVSARKAAMIADTIVEMYIIDQIAVKFEATEQATTWLSNRVAALREELERAESAVKEFNAATDLISPEVLTGLERQLKEMRDRIASTLDGREQLQARYDGLNAAQTREAQAQFAEDPQLTRFLPRVEEEPEMAAAFDTRVEQVLMRMEMDLARADQQIAALQSSETELEAQIERQGEDLITLQQLSREAEASRLLYEYFLSRLKETSAQQGIQQADSRILSNAVVPISAASPRKSLVFLVSAFLGLALGGGLVLFNEMRSNGFRNARELEAHTGYTVIGQIPIIPARARTEILAYLTEKPTSAAAEAVRNLRTSVLLSNVDNPPKVIISTSSIPGEGKTTNALALSHNLLGLGASVLLVEGDIRRRTLNACFPDAPTRGIVSVLSGELGFDEALYRPRDFGGDVLVGEHTSVNAADLFASQKFKHFVAEMRQRYDNIIIDTPPVLVVPDTRIIAQEADAVLFSVKWDSTSRAQVDEALRLFENSRQRISGLVLSQISAAGMRRYGYGDRYGAYAGYGAKYYTS